ncbi:protein TsetseEP-like [Pollicipes pollicipes]|uniref:protein TsetseEP-like n=1 Tax=Pollicipes pollicipes TaxID=41117 RepID=UPI00188575FC|nr:protein TsetseEP-like [Pollicipes pollicipes]
MLRLIADIEAEVPPDAKPQPQPEKEREPNDDIISAIENELPPDYEPMQAPSAVEEPAVDFDPALDIISAIEKELPPDYEPVSEPAPPPAEAQDPALDIISAIENELPPDYERPPSAQSGSAPGSAAAVEHSTGPGAPGRKATPATFVQFQKGGTLEPAAAPLPAPPEVQPELREAPPSVAPEDVDDSDKAKINGMVEEIVDKLEFLGVGAETVSPVKVLAIQAQRALLGGSPSDL